MSSGQNVQLSQTEFDSGVASECSVNCGKSGVHTDVDACPEIKSDLALQDHRPQDTVQCNLDAPKDCHEHKNEHTTDERTSQELDTLVDNVASSCINEAKEYFDIFMIFNEDEIDQVKKFADILRKFLTFDGGPKLRIYVDYEDLDDCYGQPKMKLFEYALENSYCYFVYLTKQSFESTWAEFQHHCALHQYIENKDLHRVVPVVCDRDVRKTISLSVYQEVDLSKLFTYGFNKIDVNQLTVKDLNMKILTSIGGMLEKGRKKHQITGNRRTAWKGDNGEKLIEDSQPTTQSVSHTRIIQTNLEFLVEHLCLEHGLLTLMFSNDVLSRREMKEVEAENTSYDQNEKFLSMISTKSSDSYKKFLDALRETNQDFIAEELQKNPLSKT